MRLNEKSFVVYIMRYNGGLIHVCVRQGPIKYGREKLVLFSSEKLIIVVIDLIT